MTNGMKPFSFAVGLFVVDDYVGVLVVVGTYTFAVVIIRHTS